MLRVAAAILKNEAGHLLICRRPAHKACGLLWEFPGGKLEAGETAADALVRECREELGVEIGGLAHLDDVVYRDEYGIMIYLSFFFAEIRMGTPACLEHCEIRWIEPAALDEYSFCPADKAILDQLKT